MPQLDPSAWFHIFAFTWLTLILLMTKITRINTHLKPKNPLTKMQTQPWIWPW